MQNGTYLIVIEASGVHDAALEYAADELAKKLVSDLQTYGHTVTKADFMSEGRPAFSLMATPPVIPAAPGKPAANAAPPPSTPPPAAAGITGHGPSNGEEKKDSPAPAGDEAAAKDAMAGDRKPAAEQQEGQQFAQ